VTEEGPGREPPGLDDPAQARRLARLSRWLQAGGIAFLAVISLGMLPRILGSLFPGLGDAAAIPLLLVSIAVPIVLLVVAALRLPR
jgi:hypothetical protein